MILVEEFTKALALLVTLCEVVMVEPDLTYVHAASSEDSYMYVTTYQCFILPSLPCQTLMHRLTSIT